MKATNKQTYKKNKLKAWKYFTFIHIKNNIDNLFLIVTIAMLALSTWVNQLTN